MQVKCEATRRQIMRAARLHAAVVRQKARPNAADRLLSSFDPVRLARLFANGVADSGGSVQDEAGEGVDFVWTVRQLFRVAVSGQPSTRLTALRQLQEIFADVAAEHPDLASTKFWPEAGSDKAPEERRRTPFQIAMEEQRAEAGPAG